MKIDDDHLFYGAAVLQVAEDDQYTSINQFEERVGRSSRKVRCAYVVNNNIGLYVKYRGEPRTAKWTEGKADEYLFHFNSSERQKLDKLAGRYPNCFVALICVRNRTIICLSLTEFRSLVAGRRKELDYEEETYVIVVANFPKSRTRPKVYVTPPGSRNKVLNEPLIVPENAYPRKIFS